MHFLIVGGGSAGCVLAARLSERADYKVTLVEAGRDLTEVNMQPHVRSRYVGRAYLDPNNIWPNLTARFGMGTAQGRPDERRYEQGRLLGGGSAINAMVANRGAPADYDEWVALGAAGWSYDELLPFFRKLESDADFSDEYHGKEGPIPIRRISEEKMSPFVKAVRSSFETFGHQLRADQNGEWLPGIYKSAIATGDKGERVPTSVGYLTDAVRSRKNLTVLTDCLAECVVFEGHRATGVRVAPLMGGEARVIEADEIIISAGGIHSPALLMRSGVGPANTLQRLQIPVVHGLRAVGQNLMEHPLTAVAAFLKTQARQQDLDEHHEHCILRYSSGIGGAPVGDMHVAMIARAGWHSIGQRIGALIMWVNKSYSRGETAIKSPDPRQHPLVDFRMLSDVRDLDRLRDGFVRCTRALLHPSMNGVRGSVFPAAYSKRVMDIAQPGRVNAVKRWVASQTLDRSGPLQARIIRKFVTDGKDIQELMSNETALNDYLLQTVSGTWHASGTCRMGLASDPDAVTDECGRVHGLQGLRVCDASIMPSIPRANTNVPTIMIAERIADMVKSA